MKVVDSVGWIEYLTGGRAADAYEEHLTDAEEIATPSIVIYEVCKRMLRDSGTRAAAFALAQMRKTAVVPLDSNLALLAAQHSLADKLAMADAIVYATARAAGATVVTSDKHFQNLPGVIFIAR